MPWRCCTSEHKKMNSKVLVYRGEGAGWRSVKSTCESVERLLSGPLRPLIKPLQVDTLSTAQLLDGTWTRHAAVLVMPGGADLPYCRHLNGRGNDIIREFVHAGGRYLGLCAGAYYGCARVVFEPGTPLEVVGDRELAFFPGIARGAAFPGFDYLTEAGAVAAQVEFSIPQALSVLQQQESSNSAGEQQHQDQQHRHVTAFDYCNGGAYLTAADGNPDIEQLPGVTVLAKYCQVPLAADPDALQQQGQQQAQVSLQQQGQQEQQQFVKRVAAVRCTVGRGVAVLCGTHPELAPEWLDPCGGSNAVEGPKPHEPVTDSMPAAAATVGVGVLQQQAQAQVASSGLQVLVQDAVASSSVPAGTSSSSSEAQAMRVVCRDAALAAHAQLLRQALQASQAKRDLLLCSLLYEALAQHRRE